MKNSIIKKSLLSLLMLAPFVTFAADEVEAPAELTLADIFTYMTLFIVALVAVWALRVAFKAFDLIVRTKELEIYKKHGLDDYLAQQKVNEGSWWQRFSNEMTGAVAIDEERKILMDHDYDGIRELDNNLPPWWLYGFYLTIVIAVIYIGVQHFSSYGKSSTEEWEIEMAQAKIAVDKYLSTQADLVDESNVEALTDAAALEAGKVIFNTNCAACHLEHGGGGPGSVGPNLTDEYWINGGGIKNVFKTIKYGVPEKGMISWKSQLRPADMHQVASYILTLEGTNPPNAKEPQGEIWKEEAEAGGEAETKAEAE